MLVESFHWPPADLAKADIDMILPMVLYYPHWKERAKRQAEEEKIFADQADWL